MKPPKTTTIATFMHPVPFRLISLFLKSASSRGRQCGRASP